jgi:hypothetical protein
MGAGDKLKKAVKDEEEEKASSESDQEQQGSASDPGKGSGGAEQAPNATVAAEEVD